MNNENKINSKGGILKDLLPMIIGEAAVVLLTCAGFVLLDLLSITHFDYRVILGALLGAVVIIVNHAWLIHSVDREINRYISIRGDKEMSEEEADAFTNKYSASIQNAMKSSFIIRTISMFAALVVAFLLKDAAFNPIATAIPLFAFRPLLSVVDAYMKKFDKTPDPSKFIQYEDKEDTEKEEN